MEKGSPESPVTIADIRVQKTLEVCLSKLYPTLRICGEESAASTAKVDAAISPDLITESVKRFISTEYLNGKQEQRRDFIQDVLRQHYGEDEV